MADDPNRGPLTEDEDKNETVNSPVDQSSDSATEEIADSPNNELATPSTEPTEVPGATANSSSWEANAAAAKESGKANGKIEKVRFERWKNFWRGYWRRKKWTLPVTILLVSVAVFGIPSSRYAVLGLVIKRDVWVYVQDATTERPVSGAIVSDGNKSAETDGQGRAILRLSVGPHDLSVVKKYYKMSQVKVGQPIFGTGAAAAVKLQATGRQVPVVVKDKIGGKPLANVEISVLGTTSKTDKDGKATLALPTTAETQKAKLSFAGFNPAEVSVQVTADAVPANTFSLTPTGKLYFLSNRSGTIDVVKTNLDGSDRKTVLAGTGSEDGNTTSLLASRDWKYLALLSKRSGQPAIYLIDTSDDSVTNIDGSANSNFTLVGWSNDIFVYTVSRTNVKNWQSGAQALKSYDAAGQKLYSIDQTQGEGTGDSDYGFSQFGTVSIIGSDLIYGKSWFGTNGHLVGKTASLNGVRADGTNKRSVKDFPIPDSAQYGFNVNTYLYEPQGVYVQVTKSDGSSGYDYYEYENGQVSSKPELTDEIYNKPYSTYLLSPNGKQTFWSDLRDNKNTLFVGNTSAGAPKQIASLSENTPYGWYTDNYLLVSNEGSQLYIMPVDGSKNPLKVTDYYKPQVSYRGYGGGYGGL